MSHTFILQSLILLCLLHASPSWAQTNWTKDPDNPVLRRDTVIDNLPNDLIAISDCWVMKEDGVYKMWYTCGGINYPADTLMRSRLCYAESTDGIVCSKYDGNPVLDVSYDNGWDSLGVETASVIIDNAAPANERYKMWYAGQYYNSYRYDIGYAVSPDGISWTKHPDPVLNVGIESAWDNGFLEGPTVLKDGDTYKMWYCGYDAIVDGNGTDGLANIGYAISLDGIVWTKHENNPVLSTGQNAWDSVFAQDPHVIKENGMYYMWYGGNNVDSYGQKVGYAWSSDGINWTKYEANPVLTNGDPGEWDANTASFPSVLNDNGVYKMWYTGKDVDPIPSSLDYYWEIGYAVDSTLVSVMNNNSGENKLTVYPNPGHGIISIEVPEAFRGAEMSIYNACGQIVVSGVFRNSCKLQLESLEMPDGLYNIIVHNGKSSLESKFIIHK